jgi:hypothetical protein
VILGALRLSGSMVAAGLAIRTTVSVISSPESPHA